MKLANALSQRSELQTRIRQLESRLNNNALVQEGEQPAEDPAGLLAELDGCAASLETLITRINLTNCQTQVGGESLTALLARRDALKLKLSIYRDLAYNASQLARRATRTEIKVLSSVSVKDVQKQADNLAKELRLLDNSIQAANWTTELI